MEAQGIELARGGRHVWYLFSDEVDAPRAVSLSPGSRLLILPGKRQAWLDVELDVRSEVERIGGAGRTVSLKAFVALNDPLADRSLGPRTMFLSRLEASPQPCPGRS